jgi:hypothetical protein
MSIFVMASGRLKEAPRFTNGKTSATMIASDAANRAQRIVITATDTAISNVLRRLNAGDVLMVTGEAAFDALSTMSVKARRVESLIDTTATGSAAQPVAQGDGLQKHPDAFR